MSTSEIRRVTVDYPEGIAVRFDKYVCDDLHLCPRSKIKECCTQMTVNGKPAKYSTSVRNGDCLEFSFTAETRLNPYAKPSAESIDFDVLYEDDTTLIINKPYGLVVHPAPGNETGTLVNGILSYFREDEIDDFEEESRPGIVHRLDKDTSGVILVAKTREALDYYAACFRNRNVKKEYRAVLRGVLRGVTGEIDRRLVRHRKDRKRYTVTDSPDCGRSALTFYRELKRWKDRYSLAALFPQTGRTHQLRVHMLSEGAPILGDPVYGRPDALFPEQRLMLHAFRLTVVLFGDSATRTFEAPLPPVFEETVRRLDGLFGDQNRVDGRK